MLRRTALIALALLAGVLTLLAPTARAQELAPQVPWMGTMVDGPVISPSPQDFDTQWPLMRGAHLGMVRLAFYWPDLEPEKGTYDLRGTDGLVQRAAAQGLDVLPVILRTPDWTRSSRRDGAPPKDRAAYGRLLGQLVARYGPQGSFWTEHPELPKHDIRSWQVWNEPDLKPYWNEKDWAKGYVKLLKAAHSAIKRADPGAKVILAGLTNQSWEGLAQVYRAGGRRYFDEAALHVYTSNAKGVLKVVGFARKVMKRNGDGRKKIALTEVAWPSSKGKRPGTRPWETTESGQAAKVRSGLPALAKGRKRLGINEVVWYSWLTVEDRKTWQTYAGLLRLRKGKVVQVAALRSFRSALAKLAR